MPNIPDAVIFDMDGIIFDSETLVFDCWKAVASKYNMDHVENVCKRCLGVNRQEAERIFKEYYGQDLPYTERKAEMAVLFHERFRDGRDMLKPHVREILKTLKDAGIKTAIASSTRRELVVLELDLFDILGYFDKLVCGDMVSHSKPHPEIFQKACEELGVSPEQAVGIEDSYNGIRSSSAAGLRTIMVPDKLPANDEMTGICEAVCEDLGQVMEYLLN